MKNCVNKIYNFTTSGYMLFIIFFFTGLINRGQTLTDYDNNVYKTVRIGNQVWMAENLAVTHYSNGEPIPCISGNKEWKKTKTGAWSDYNNHAYNATLFGHLYNWKAVCDPRNLCPAGWHVPSDNDWEVLINSLGSNWVAGGKLKATGLWLYPFREDNNSSGFSALPGGCRLDNGEFIRLAASATFWTSTAYSKSAIWGRRLFYDHRGIIISREPVGNGCSVRCIRN
jgi:uncharacterized protein (TIGR02145 family)